MDELSQAPQEFQSQASVSQQSVQQTTSNFIPQKPLIPKSILILLFIFILIAFGGSYFFMNRNNAEITPVPTPIRIFVSPTPTIDPTTNWKIYTNNEYGFSISRPLNWKIVPEYPNSFIPPDLAANLNNSKISVTVLDRPQNYLNTPFAEYVKIAAGVEIQSHESLISIEKVTTNTFLIGYKTKWKIAEEVPSPYKTSTITYFETPKKDNSKTIQVFISDEKYLDTYNQIIATFKYNDQIDIEGKDCGGIAGEKGPMACPTGYYCKYTDHYPDASGKCTKIIEKTH